MVRLIKVDLPDSANALQKLNKAHKKGEKIYWGKNSVKEITAYDLTIIIPFYNSEETIVEAVESVLSQRTGDFRILIKLINDGSTDDSLQLVRNYEELKNIEIITLKHGGISAARNAGIKNLDSKYVLFMDADDVLAERGLLNLLEPIREDNFDVIQGGFEYFYGDNTRKTRLFNGKSNHYTDKMTSGFPWGKLIRSVDLTNFSFPKGYIYEDTALLFLVYPFLSSFTAVSEVCYRYRINPNGISSSSENTAKEIDSFWITQELMNLVSQKREIDTDIFQEIFLKQVRMNFLRTMTLGMNIQQSVFVLTVELLRENFSNCKVKNYTLRKIYRSLIDEDFLLYFASCLEHI